MNIVNWEKKEVVSKSILWLVIDYLFWRNTLISFSTWPDGSAQYTFTFVGQRWTFCELCDYPYGKVVLHISFQTFYFLGHISIGPLLQTAVFQDCVIPRKDRPVSSFALKGFQLKLLKYKVSEKIWGTFHAHFHLDLSRFIIDHVF